MAGRLTQRDKYTIQGMIHNNKSVGEIAKTLKRAEKTIDKYVENELKMLLDTVKNVRVQKELQQATNNKETLIQNVVNRLVKDGADAVDANKWVVEALTNNCTDDPEVLYQNAISSKKAGDFMIKKTGDKGDRTISVMTEVASQRGDESRKRRSDTISRTARNSVYDLTTGDKIK